MTSVWITGADGFIGRQLSRHLADGNGRVAGLGHRTAGKPDTSHFIDFEVGEVSSAALASLRARHGSPDVIYHLAGGASVGSSLAAPYEDFRRTVVATAEVLEWMRLSAPRTRLVFVSSAAIYGDGHDGPIAEDAAIRPFSPYGAHKYAAEQLCQSARTNFGTDVVIVRPFSIYGNGLCKQLLWDSCRRLTEKPEVLLLGGNGKEFRDWLHVDDLCQLLMLTARPDIAAGAIVNAGRGFGVSVSEVVAMLLDAWGGDVSLRFSGERRMGDPSSLVADMSLATSWGFTPKTDLQRGIAAYVDWFRAL